jgi:hypothetical protein
MGNWKPTSGGAEIYHFAAEPPKLEMLAKYKEWYFITAEQKYTAPVHP